jgi:hypothetical protein
MHEERGRCKAEGLVAILKSIQPDVVFLEALESTYSDKAKTHLKVYNCYDRKLEIKALQMYGCDESYVYVPVLDYGMDEKRFTAKYRLLESAEPTRSLLFELFRLTEQYGLEYLNTRYATALIQDMRQMEFALLGQHQIGIDGSLAIDEYENNMLDNIYNYARNASFENAVFLCGAAHRSSMWEKVQIRNKHENLGIEWKLYEVEH